MIFESIINGLKLLLIPVMFLLPVVTASFRRFRLVLMARVFRKPVANDELAELDIDIRMAFRYFLYAMMSFGSLFLFYVILCVSNFLFEFK